MFVHLRPASKQYVCISVQEAGIKGMNKWLHPTDTVDCNCLPPKLAVSIALTLESEIQNSSSCIIACLQLKLCWVLQYYSTSVNCIWSSYRINARDLYFPIAVYSTIVYSVGFCSLQNLNDMIGILAFLKPTINPGYHHDANTFMWNHRWIITHKCFCGR